MHFSSSQLHHMASLFLCLQCLYQCIFTMQINTTNSLTVTPPQRAHCKLTPIDCCLSLSGLFLKGLVIHYGEGGYKMGKSSEAFCNSPPPPHSRQGKTFCAPPFKHWQLFAPPPSIWLKLQATAKKIPPKNVFCLPFSMAKTFSAPPLFVGLS